jgi:threonine dehydratase
MHRLRSVIPLDDIEAARERIRGAAIRTPLVRLGVDDAPAEIWLKLENLQPIGSFKIRGAVNAIRLAAAEDVARGVVTASAGNMAQGVAWAARELGVSATIVVPEHAPQTKIDAIERLGGTVVKVPYERWWEAIVESRFDEADGLFVHPVQDPPVMAGNGTIGLELAEELGDFDAVLVPFGGGGLVAGIASALRGLGHPASAYAIVPETGAAIVASLNAGRPVAVEYTPSFVDGSGAGGVLPRMWEVVQPLLAGAEAVSLDETAAAVRLLAERARVVAEGAGALAVAAATAGRVRARRIVCIVSGGNIDATRLAAILGGETPD